jgi:hypothetical protein
MLGDRNAGGTPTFFERFGGRRDLGVSAVNDAAFE